MNLKELNIAPPFYFQLCMQTNIILYFNMADNGGGHFYLQLFFLSRHNELKNVPKEMN